VGARLLELAVHDPAAGARRQAAAEADHARGVAGQQLEVHPRLAAMEPLQEAGARQRHEVAEALVVRRQERQVVALDLLAAYPAVVHEVGLEPHKRLDAVLLARLAELHGAVHHTVIGERDGGLAEARGAFGELVDLAGAVEQRILGMDVEVDAAGCRHGLCRL